MYVNFLVHSKDTRLTQGHLNSEDLYQKILSQPKELQGYACYFDLKKDNLKNEYWTGQYTIETDKNGNEYKAKLYTYLKQTETPTTDFYKPELTFTQYEGPVRPALNCVSFDFDSSDFEKVLNDVKKFIAWVDVPDLAIFFSGSKGFHVLIPFGYFPLDESPNLHLQLKDMATELKQTYPTLDNTIYNYNRKFRTPFSQHESGLYKTFFPHEQLNNYNETEIKAIAQKQCIVDFLDIIKPTLPREPLEIFIELHESCKRKSYEVEKVKAGTKDAPTPFEKYDGKLCIKKLLDSRCDDVGRNNACLRIVNDFYRIGKLQKDCEDVVYAWATKVGLPASEVSLIIRNVYNGNANYNFGCQDEIKSTYCTAKCELWRKLAEDKRPIVADAPLDKKSTLKNEFQAVQMLLEKMFGSVWNMEKSRFEVGSIIKHDATRLFYYKDNHWQYLDDMKKDVIKTKINNWFDNKLDQKKLENIYKMFMMYVPAKPDEVDLYAPRNDRANFLDGTLHLERNNNKFELVFKNHNKLDFCTTIIEHNYKDFMNNRYEKNEAFESWLLEYLKDNQENFLLIQEMFGASLMPKFPQLFVLIGKSGTGKSTTIKILKKLHKNDKNICGVSPDKFHGFNMASMIGKLMNIVSDIKTKCYIDDDVVKQIDDQEPVRIEIKRGSDIYTRLPALHIFGANNMPKTDEGGSGAMNRRVKLIDFSKEYKGEKNTEIASDLYNANPLGVFCFALNGLFRLVDQAGEFTKSSSSAEKVEGWAKNEDYLSQFLIDFEHEGIDIGGKITQIVFNNEGKIDRKVLWKAFEKWQIEAIESRNQIGKVKFFSLISARGFEIVKNDALRSYRGMEIFGEFSDSV